MNTAPGKDPKNCHLGVVAAKFNLQGNLLFSARADQTAKELLHAAAIFILAINPNNLGARHRPWGQEVVQYTN